MQRLAVPVMLLVFACARELPQDAVKTVVDRSGEGKRVIFVGLDGADWRLLDRFTADGTMPHLAVLLASAERRVLHSQHPPLSPLVWTTMMTGVSPLEHRILDFTRFDPRTRRQEPITSGERAVPALWNMVRYGGKRVAVFGLWATWPAEPGVILTDRDVPLHFLAATEETHRRAMTTIRRDEPDLAIVYFQGTDEIGHLTRGDVEKARGYFARIDAILEDYRKLAGDLEAELLVASDHGFDWGGAHEESSTATATAAKWHRDEGIWIHWPGERTMAAPARVDQVCSTILNLLGLPMGEGLAGPMDGSRGQSVNYRRYFKPADSNGSSPASSSIAAEQVAKLQALGYLSSSAVPPASAATTRTPQSFNNEGLVLREHERTDEAEKSFREALAIDPDYSSARQNLDDLLSTRGVERLREGDCAGAAGDFREIRRESALLWAARATAEGCLGNEADAVRAARRSLALDPDQPELLRMLE